MRPTAAEQQLRGQPRPRGFTLMEMVVAIVVLSVVAVMMTPLIKQPMQAYLEAQQRTELQTQLDLARSKLSDDLQTALPGSVRVMPVGAVQYLEYLEVRASGRYRTTPGGAGACPAVGNGNAFQPGVPGETCFTTLGALQGSAVVPGSDSVLVWPGPPTTPYTPTMRSLINAVAQPGINPVVYQISFAAQNFAGNDPLKRFYIVSQPVSYVCNPATGTLTRYWGYAILPAQPNLAYLSAAAQSAPLSNLVAGCKFSAPAVGNATVISVQLRLQAGVPGQPVETAGGLMQFAVREPFGF